MCIGDHHQRLLRNPGIDLPSPLPLPALRSIWWWQEPPLVLYRTVLWCFNSTSLPLREEQRKKAPVNHPHCLNFLADIPILLYQTWTFLGVLVLLGCPPSWPLLPAELTATGFSCFLLFALGVVDKSPRPRKG